MSEQLPIGFSTATYNTKYKPIKNVFAKVFILSKQKRDLIARVNGIETRCNMRVMRTLNPVSGSYNLSKVVTPLQAAEVELSFDRYLAMEPFSVSGFNGRLLLYSKDKLFGIGIITSNRG